MFEVGKQKEPYFRRNTAPLAHLLKATISLDNALSSTNRTIKQPNRSREQTNNQQSVNWELGRDTYWRKARLIVSFNKHSRSEDR